jgi:hypothetical protein
MNAAALSIRRLGISLAGLSSDEHYLCLDFMESSRKRTRKERCPFSEKDVRLAVID